MSNTNCNLDCLNYEGMKCDAEEAVRMLLKLANNETTPERAKEWARLNWPRIFESEKAKADLAKILLLHYFKDDR